MENDLGFASDAAVATDGTYDSGIFGSDLSDTQESERRVGSQPIPRFKYYALKVIGCAAQSTDVEFPNGAQVTYFYPRFTLEVVNGPKDTKGRQFFSNVYFHTNPNKWEKNGSQRPKTAAEMEKATKTLKAVSLQIARVLGLSRPTPTANTEEACEAWARQALDAGKTFIGEVRIEKGDAEKGYDPRNSVSWFSIAALGDPVYDDNKKQIPNETAGSQALKQIAKFDERSEKKSGTTAKSHGPAKPSNF